jgi:hypothetical protein
MGLRWQKSNSMEFDGNGEPAPGATAYFYQGGTTTPLTVYQDADEATPHESPVEADGNGRWPLVFVPYCTSFDELVATEGGTQLWYDREIPNLDPIEASEDSVDDADLIQTGDCIFSPATGTRTGFVRANARTIGSAASGATERANADTSDLYTFLWNNFSNSILAVSTGRGASAAADFAANKTIALFDGRGACLRGLDDMGNSAASALTLATFTTGSAIIGGSIAGANSHTLTIAQLAAHTHGGVTGTESATHTHSGTTGTNSADHTHLVSGNTGTNSVDHTHDYTKATTQAQNYVHGAGSSPYGADTTATTTGQSATHTHSVSITSAGQSVTHTHDFTSGNASATHTHTISSQGGDTAHNNVSKSILGTIYIRL